MRQAGVLAAAALYALENNFERLAEDHDNASRLAQRLAGMPGIEVDLDSVQTNIIMARLPVIGADDLVEELRQRGVLIHAITPDSIRLVTHLDLSAADVDRASSIIDRTLSELVG